MGEADPGDKLAPFAALIGEWDAEMTHPLVEGTVHGRVTYEWLEGHRFLLERSTVDHPDFPDALAVIGVMEGETELSKQSFDSRGIHRVMTIAFDGMEMTTQRDDPAFAQRLRATLSADGSTLTGLSQLNRDGQGYRDDLAFTYRRVCGPDS